MAAERTYNLVGSSSLNEASDGIATKESAKANVTTIMSPQEIQQWLEWAGAMLLSMRISSPVPRESGSAWPDYADEWTARGYTTERLRPAAPNRFEIDIMDKVLALPAASVSNITVRRILHTRALVAPVRNRHIYSWERIAVLLHTSRARVVRMHRMGLELIVSRTPEANLYALRQSLKPWLT